MASKNRTKTRGTRPAGAGSSGVRSGGRPGAGNRPGSAKQRAKAARAVAAAQQARSRRNSIIVTFVACLAILVVIVAAVSYAMVRSNQQKTDSINATSVTANFPVTIDNGTVLAGKASAPTTIDIYEDFLCPYCEQLETTYGKDMLNDLNNGSLRIRYRIVNLLNDSSSPSGYSTRAANAAFATVAAGKFISYHWSLYRDQPEEQSPGYSNDQLLSLGKRLGITGSAYETFKSHVESNTYGHYATTQLNKLEHDSSLHDSDGSYGTPTVVHDGQKVDTSKSDWLTSLVNG